MLKSIGEGGFSNRLHFVARTFYFRRDAEIMNYCASTFEDELFSATDLNRRAGYVLDRALLHPVTITRNEQAFALLPRENMSRLVETARYTQTLLELANLAFRLIQGNDIGLDHPNVWLKSFDTEEINELRDCL
jgi:hypothetical protein